MFFKRNTSTGITSEIRVRRCYGCGAILQDKNSKEDGYIPTEKLNSGDEVLCERCYKLRHYSSYKQSSFNVDFATILLNAKEEKALGVFVFNAFSLNGSLIEEIQNYLPDNLLIIINKKDVLPPEITSEYLKSRLQIELKKVNIEANNILITSANDSNSIKELLDSINKLRKGKNVYFFGSYQVGKSSLVNEILKNYTNETSKLITTSPYPGTTLNTIAIPLDKNSYLYDTPGISNPKSITSIVEPVIAKFIQPRKLIKPEIYNAKVNQSFLISNLARVDFVAGNKANFTFYKSNDLTIYRAKTDKVENMLEHFNDKNDDLHSNMIHNMSDFALTSFDIQKENKYIIRINSLAFIKVSGDITKIDVYAPKGVSVSIEII